VIAEKRVHILGTFADIHVARDALVSLILGSPPNKVYAKLKTVAARMKAQ
jgi:RNA-binding protein PNO1